MIRAALSFLDALLAGDGTALAAASSTRFGFDGEWVEGREAQARRWREILSRRPSGNAVLRDLVPLTAAEAVAQLGPPPARLAGLLRPGVWVVVADVSSRPVLLLLVAEGGRFAVAAMHD